MLKKIIIFLIPFFFIQLALQAQIKFQVNNSASRIYYLQKIAGDRINTLDSASAQGNRVVFTWKESYQRGMYRLNNGKDGIVFWSGPREVVLQINEPLNQKNLTVINSEENQQWIDYLKLKNKTYQNLDLLNPLINWYDRESEFYKSAIAEFEDQQRLLPAFIQKLTKEHPDSWLLPFLVADLKPKLPEGLSLEEQKEYLKQHWFDSVNWQENSLIRSDILTNKITEYLGLYANQNLKKAALENAFKDAMDQIIPKTQDNPEMYAFVLDYLVRGFERFNFEEVILHIAQTYPPPIEQCENEVRKSAALARLEKYESMQIGQTAPDFELPNLQGEMVKLSDCKKEKILLVFWASWCPHCKEIIPQINTWYSAEKQKTWHVYTISIDNSKEDLQTYLKSKNINLPVLCNYKGWDTRAAVDYNIYATPTMIVLDNELRILSKPMRLGELR